MEVSSRWERVLVSSESYWWRYCLQKRWRSAAYGWYFALDHDIVSDRRSEYAMEQGYSPNRDHRLVLPIPRRAPSLQLELVLLHSMSTISLLGIIQPCFRVWLRRREHELRNVERGVADVVVGGKLVPVENGELDLEGGFVS
jgi:hypothetical protein